MRGQISLELAFVILVALVSYGAIAQLSEHTVQSSHAAAEFEAARTIAFETAQSLNGLMLLQKPAGDSAGNRTAIIRIPGPSTLIDAPAVNCEIVFDTAANQITVMINQTPVATTNYTLSGGFESALPQSAPCASSIELGI